MYKIIGADQKQYGPISGDQIRQWISEGRVNGETLACAEGSDDWKPISEFPEFGFTATPVPAATPPSFTGPMTREEIIARDYSIDIMSCFSRGWKLYKENFGVMFVATLLLVILTFAASGLVEILFAAAGLRHISFASKQYLTPVRLLFTMLVIGPASGGLFYVIISLMRGKDATAGEVFTGFKSFQDLYLGTLIPRIVGALIMFPFTYVVGTKIGPLIDRIDENPQAMNPQEFFPQLLSGFSSSLPILLLCLIPAAYFGTNWLFTAPLIVDKQMGFWTALRTSWKMAHKHWFHIFVLWILVTLVNIPGACLCGIGVLFTIPLGLAALCYAYEDIFGRQNA